MGGAIGGQCKELGMPCCMGSPEDPGTEVRTEVPTYAGLAGPAAPPYESRSPGFAPPSTGADDNAPIFVPSPTGGGGGGGIPGTGSPGGAGVSADAILSDLESAEMKAYQEAFISFAGGGPVPLDNAQMRQFLMDNAAIDDIEITLLGAMNDSMQLEMGGFLDLLRNNSMSDGDIIGQFGAFSTDGEQLAAEECRNGLTMIGMQKFGVTYSDDRWDSILNMVMMDAGPSVQLEGWMMYCKVVARYIRLFQYCNV